MKPTWNRVLIYSFLASILIHALVLAGGSVVSVHEQPEDDNTIVTEIVTTDSKEKSDLSDKNEKNKDPEKEKEKSRVDDRDKNKDLAKDTPKEDKKSEDSPKKKPGPRDRRAPEEKTTSSKQVLKVKERDEMVRKVMRSVKNKIDPVWQNANPPSKGRVMLEIAIDSEGRVAVLNGPKLQNSDLGKYVYSLVRNAAPFETAMQHRSKPIRIECVFNVRDQ